MQKLKELVKVAKTINKLLRQIIIMALYIAIIIKIIEALL